MKELKFTHKFGEKKLSVTFYEDQRLRKVKGIKKNIHPIYLRIVFDRITLRVRSILWQRLLETNNDFSLAVVFDNKKKERVVAEGFADIEESFVKDKARFSQLCEYEFECLKRIIVFACQSQPSSVKQIIEAYGFWGQDGLREVCKTMIEQIFPEDADDGTRRNRSFELRKYPPISRTLRKFIKDAMITYDPVSVVCLIDEIQLVEKTNVDGKLWDDYNRLMLLIGNLCFQSADVEGIPLALYYFPKIHFYYPISDDLSKRSTIQKKTENDSVKAIDLLKFQSYLSS